MKALWSILKWSFIGWGIVCFVGLVVIVGTIWYRIGPANVDVSGTASAQDVRFILNWCGLGDERIQDVVHSFRSARSLTGDHLDVYAIRISHVHVEELKRDDFGSGWFRCNELDGVLKDAVEFAAGWLNRDEIGWFLTKQELNSDGVFVYPHSIYCHGTRPSAVELIFVRPKDKMVFYMSTKA